MTVGKEPPLTPEQAQAASEALFAHFFNTVAVKRILAEAQCLRDRAEKAGCLDDVAAIMCPSVKRKRGRRTGSRSAKVAEDRRKLWEAYCKEKQKTPDASIEDIAKRLEGHSTGAIAARIRKMEANSQFSSLIYRRAGIKRKVGRPKK